jgi:hypothetical protein
MQSPLIDYNSLHNNLVVYVQDITIELKSIRSKEWDGTYSTRAYYVYIIDGRSTGKI